MQIFRQVPSGVSSVQYAQRHKLYKFVQQPRMRLHNTTLFVPTQEAAQSTNLILCILLHVICTKISQFLAYISMFLSKTSFVTNRAA